MNMMLADEMCSHSLSIAVGLACPVRRRIEMIGMAMPWHLMRTSHPGPNGEICTCTRSRRSSGSFTFSSCAASAMCSVATVFAQKRECVHIAANVARPAHQAIGGGGTRVSVG